MTRAGRCRILLSPFDRRRRDVAIGLPIALYAAQFLKSLMYGISEVDCMTFAAVTLFFLALGPLAGLIPARRAARLDPVTALRAE